VGISSPLLAKLVYVANLFRSATHLRKEFAWRLLAKPGDSEFNRLAVEIFFLLPKLILRWLSFSQKIRFLV
jgi:16S rRNA A1518/A1519 N6-dimethyltransferase RsmA/KsgA/DIM1 with predicted DNA glycosylase/AP lyase activity